MVQIFLGYDRPSREQMRKKIKDSAGSYAVFCLNDPHSSSSIEGMWECWRLGHYDEPVYKEVEEGSDVVLTEYIPADLPTLSEGEEEEVEEVQRER